MAPVDMGQVRDGRIGGCRTTFAGRIASELMSVHVSVVRAAEFEITPPIEKVSLESQLCVGRTPTMTTEFMTFTIAASNASPSPALAVSPHRHFHQLQDHLQIDRYRMLSARDDVLLMHVDADEAVEECQPCAGAPEVSLKALPINTTRVIDELRPAVVLSRQNTNRPQLNGVRGGSAFRSARGTPRRRADPWACTRPASRPGSR